MKLSRSQRVNVIQNIAEVLENDDWTSIDLVLNQFSFPTSNQWTGETRSYIIEMIRDAKDSDLVELAEHFRIQFNKGKADEPPPSPPYWAEGKLRVFLSHLTAKREQAANIQKALDSYGMSAFVAHNDIQPTIEWQLEIETALSTCDLLVALIHPKFIESKWCDQEVGYALGRGIPVFTVRCGADPYGFVSRFQGFNGNSKDEFQIAKELFEAATAHKKLQDKMASVLIDLFVNSGSFTNAMSRVAYLEQLTVWDESFSDRLKKAVKINDQISGSWGVPERVAKLIEKWK